jgi:phospholipid/cholesterol/gamma-HCH transport system permease protein
MAIDPRQRVLAPRFLAGIISMPLLAILFSAIGILGAWLVAVGLIGIDAGNFWSIQQNAVDVWRDVGNGVVKSAVFGVICTAVALYQGYETEATPEGVAYATTRTVVISSLAVLGADFILTALMFSAPR